MHITSDKAIVLKKTLYQDNKLIVCIFTQDHGLINISAVIGKKQLFKFGCLEIGHEVSLDLLKLKTSYKLKDISLASFPKTLRDNLCNMTTLARACQNLSFILPEGLSNPIFFTFLSHAFKAFDIVECKKTWSGFIFLKWLQVEGLIDIITCPPSLQKEIDFFLKIKQFNHLKTMSSEALVFIEQQLCQHK